MADIEHMRYHGPGWVLDLAVRDESGDVIKPGALYQLWAPQDGAIPDPYGYADHQSSEWTPRAHWAASWQSADRDDGAFVKGDDPATVLAVFGPDVRRRFSAALQRAISAVTETP